MAESKGPFLDYTGLQYYDSKIKTELNKKVKTVNGKSPNSSGNVTITSTDIGALPSNGTSQNSLMLNGATIDKFSSYESTEVFSCTFYSNSWSFVSSDLGYKQRVTCTGLKSSYDCSTPWIKKTGNKSQKDALQDAFNKLMAGSLTTFDNAVEAYVDSPINTTITIYFQRAIEGSHSPSPGGGGDGGGGGTNLPLQPLIFTGAVNATYNGTQTVEVNIPTGGGGQTNNGIVFNDTYTTNANGWVSTNGYIKTSDTTTNLPVSGSNAWGILFFIAENKTNQTGTQMYWPVDGTKKGTVWTRSVANGTNFSTWKQLATLDDIGSGGGSGTITEETKQEIIQEVLNRLPTWNGGSF